jgi:hypothetical protein
MTSQQRIQDLKSTSKKGIALDIDETLSWTVGWWTKQLQDLFGNPENLSVKELVKKYRYTQEVPYWQTKEALQWMEDNRASNQVQTELPLINGALEGAKKINEIIPVIAYITTRPDNVVKGTQTWLNKHGFPSAPIIARPLGTAHSDGNKWKAQVLAELEDIVLGIVDDNPELITHLPKSYKGTIFSYDNDTVSRDDIHIIPCKTWSRVVKEVERMFS